MAACALRDETYPTRKSYPEMEDATEYLFWDQELDDRQGAVQMHENHCQIAEAIKRCHPEMEQVWVKVSRIAARYQDGSVKVWVVPTALRSRIQAFDQGGRISDGSYFALPISPSHTKEATAAATLAYKKRPHPETFKTRGKVKATR
jgi:hypothetical protein